MSADVRGWVLEVLRPIYPASAHRKQLCKLHDHCAQETLQEAHRKEGRGGCSVTARVRMGTPSGPASALVPAVLGSRRMHTA